MTKNEEKLLAALKSLRKQVTMSDLAFCWANVYAGLVIEEIEREDAAARPINAVESAGGQ